MKVKDIRSMSAEELAQKEKALKKQLYDLRYQRKIGRVEKPAQFKNARRDIARILTILQERKTDGTKAK
jgi:large subunit ribosomal protein L29